MTVKTIPLSHNRTPLMALADAALGNGESPASQSKLTEKPSKESVSTTTPMDRLTFAQQLMKLLDDDVSPFLKWMPDGKSFTIKNCKQFTSDEMPKLFNIRNMSSFVRKLTKWGFSRHHEKETMNFDIFKHTHFVRGDWDRCAQIKCTVPQVPVAAVTAIRNVRKATSSAKSKAPAPQPSSPVQTTTATKSTPSPVQTQKKQERTWKPLVHPALISPVPHSNLASNAALKSLAAVERATLDHHRANLLTLQLLQEASQTYQQNQALLQHWLAQRLPTSQEFLSHAQLAALRR